MMLCQIIGGYSKTPVRPGILTDESLARSQKDGPCLSIAELPVLKGDLIEIEVLKIFHHPVLHEREILTGSQIIYSKPRS
jgi:hypothetical protein